MLFQTALIHPHKKSLTMKRTLLALVFGACLAQTASAQSITLSKTGTLSVVGGFRDETIVIYAKTTYRRGRRPAERIYAKIQAFGSTVQDDFPSHLVDRIVVDGMDGHDYIDNQTDIQSDLNGGEGNDEIHGGSNNDWIRGGNGNNELYGNEGRDTLISNGQKGNWMSGGAGLDKFFYYGGDSIDDQTFADDNVDLFGMGFLLWPDYVYSGGMSMISE
jgi:hypothetical protein